MDEVDIFRLIIFILKKKNYNFPNGNHTNLHYNLYNSVWD